MNHLVFKVIDTADHAAVRLGSAADFLAASASLIRSNNQFKSIRTSKISRIVSADFALKDCMFSLLDGFNSTDNNHAVLVIGSLDGFPVVAINAAPKNFGIEFSGKFVAACAASRLDNGVSGSCGNKSSHHIVLPHLDVSCQSFIDFGDVSERLVLGTVALASMAFLELLRNISGKVDCLFDVEQGRSESYHKGKDQGKIHSLVCHPRGPCLSDHLCPHDYIMQGILFNIYYAITLYHTSLYLLLLALGDSREVGLGAESRLELFAILATDVTTGHVGELVVTAVMSRVIVIHIKLILVDAVNLDEIDGVKGNRSILEIVVATDDRFGL